MKQLLILAFLTFLFVSCGNDSSQTTGNDNNSGVKQMDPSTYDPKRGEGKYDQVDLSAAIDPNMVAKGQEIVDTKCFACHYMDSRRLVGPGWEGLMTKHKPEWIMNFITEPAPMIDKDPELQAQLEICLVRMPNQSLTDDDARNVLEFMRQNDLDQEANEGEE